MVAVIDSVIVFVVSALVGGIGIYAGALLLSDARSYEHAVWTPSSARSRGSSPPCCSDGCRCSEPFSRISRTSR